MSSWSGRNDHGYIIMDHFNKDFGCIHPVYYEFGNHYRRSRLRKPFRGKDPMGEPLLRIRSLQHRHSFVCGRWKGRVGHQGCRRGKRPVFHLAVGPPIPPVCRSRLTCISSDTRAKLPSIRTYLQSVRDKGLKNVIVPFVVYDLPDRDCAALASNGELSIANGGAAIYKAQYIDVIRATLLDFPEIPIALVIEPDSLANMVTNMGVAKCSGAAETYKTLVVYAVQQLALPNVSMYLDGGHGGWLGWPANLPGAATLFAQIRKSAGSPSQLRGLATNVANYNGWSLATW